MMGDDRLPLAIAFFSGALLWPAGESVLAWIATIAKRRQRNRTSLRL